MICHAAPARVGILGNPSDAYEGRTLALAVPQFTAAVTLEPADGVEILGQPADEPCWTSMKAMTDHIDRHGYGTGPQLLAASVRTFVDVADAAGHPLGDGFRLSYTTDIPRQVGLGGSSALVVATLRCLADHHGLELPDRVLPSIALRVETAQLGLTAGLQDRVVQTYGGLVAMDFGNMTVDTQFGLRYGQYDPVDPSSLPLMFLAYRESAAQLSSEYHLNIRERYEAGDPKLRETLRELASLVVEGRAALRWRDEAHLAELIRRDMQLRKLLGPLPRPQLELVDTAEAVGATATFAGSGGAVVGVYTSDDHFEQLSDAFADIGADVVDLGRTVDATADGDDDAFDPPTEPANVVSLQRRQG